MRLNLPRSLPYYPRRINTKLTISALIISLSLSTIAVRTMAQETSGNSTCPSESPIAVNVPNLEFRPISLENGSRPGNCITPDMIFMHATEGGTLESNWELFNGGGLDGNGTNAHFIIGEDGKILQTVPLYQSKVEFAATNTPMNNRSIGIEMVHPTISFEGGKSGMDPKQYTAALQLVTFLMNQYNIPLGPNEADWVSEQCYDADNPDWSPGVYGHYQIGTCTHQDPGKQWLTDFRSDLRNGNIPAGSSTGSGPAGRLVPYDAYARPYSWPISGTIRQNYGFTEQAQNLGLRYPRLYPKGDPGVIFSTTNHVEPPPNPEVDKFINPNIDITPRSNDRLARAVYSTHAGWVTYADWAGPEKGYTIQVESDVDGDGQADLASRYMRLQAPEGGFFAPDIALFHPSSSNIGAVFNGECTDPPNEDWATVNKWDEQVKLGIIEAKSTEQVDVPCNLVKAFMKLESGGVEMPPNVSGYMGLMQVGYSWADGGGSDCSHDIYVLEETQGNVNCGVQEMARGYKNCNNSWDGAILKYFSGRCYDSGAADAFGTTTGQYLEIVKSNWEYLESQAGKQLPPDVPSPESQTSPPPAATMQNPDLPAPYIIEAEAMDRPSGVDLIHDNEASGEYSVRLRSNGEITTQVDQPADNITIRVKGEQCSGNPEIKLMMDGIEFATLEVPSDEWTDLTTSAPFDGGTHQYSISFENDFTIMSGAVCDRNVFIDKSTLEVTNPSAAQAKTLSEQKIEAELLTDYTTSGNSDPEIKEEEGASAGKFVRMVDSSTIEGKAEIAKGNWIKIRVRGTECEGWPHVVVKVDGTIALETDVQSQTWIEYSSILNLQTALDESNEHTINVAFTNDKYVGPWCDRNLDVDVITIQDNTVSQTPNNANSLIGKTKYVGYNQLIGYVSSARDHEKPGTNYGEVPNANQTYLSYRIMYNNPTFTTFPSPDTKDAYINAKVDNPYIIETADNTVAGSLKVAFDHLNDPMWFFCALRITGNQVKCIDAPNP